MIDVRPDLIVPTNDNYRRHEVFDGFTFERGVLSTGEDGLYLVSFRSMRRTDAAQQEIDRLEEFDEAAHQEADESGGLIHYYPDPVDEEGRASSYCIWESKEAAKTASELPLHKAAINYALKEARIYETYRVLPFKLLRPLGSRGLSIVALRHPGTGPEMVS